MEISDKDKELIRKFESIRQRGYYVSGQEVVGLYNKVLERNKPVTNCSSCLRSYIQELVDALNRYERVQARQAELAQEALKNNDPNNSPSDENKATVDETIKQPVEVKKGRPKKK